MEGFFACGFVNFVVVKMICLNVLNFCYFQTSIVQNLVQELCSIENASPCQFTQPTLSLHDTMQSCNFMPINPQYLQGNK